MQLTIPRDPRLYQLTVLSGLLAYGLAVLDFSVSLPFCLVVLASVTATQALFSRWIGLPIDLRSSLISGLSLCLLLRTDRLEIAALAGFVAIASKFLLRRGGRHLVNPTAFALVAMILLTDRAWVSPGQWGRPAVAGFLIACLGGVVVQRAARADVTFAFLGAYATLVFGRALWLGDPLAIPLHQMATGSLLLFAFFMISDPKTTPSSRAGRMLFAALVAAGAVGVQFVLYRPNGLLYALVAGAVALPAIDRLFPGETYRWPSRRTASLRPLPELAAASAVAADTRRSRTPLAGTAA